MVCWGSRKVATSKIARRDLFKAPAAPASGWSAARRRTVPLLGAMPSCSYRQPTPRRTLHVRSSQVDGANTYYAGPTRVPAGAIFEFKGRAFGPATDPDDIAHRGEGGKWKGLPKAESDRSRRTGAERSRRALDKTNRAALITLSEVLLTKKRVCADPPVAAAASPPGHWNWDVAPVFGSSDSFYGIVGIVRAGKLFMDFEAERDPLEYAINRGVLAGILQGTTDRTINVPHDP